MAIRDARTEGLRVKIYREMSPQQRMWLAAQLYEEGMDNLRAAILDRNPNLPPDRVEREVRRRVLPRILFEQVEAEIQRRKQNDTIPYAAQSH